jgi:hypothetical protein
MKRFFIILFVSLSLIACAKNKETKTANHQVQVQAFQGTGMEKGKVSFTVYDDLFGKQRITFIDCGFDGTLDKVIYIDKGERYEVTNPIVIQNNWYAKYLEVRQWATESNDE